MEIGVGPRSVLRCCPCLSKSCRFLRDVAFNCCSASARTPREGLVCGERSLGLAGRRSFARNASLWSGGAGIPAKVRRWVQARGSAFVGIGLSGFVGTIINLPYTPVRRSASADTLCFENRFCVRVIPFLPDSDSQRLTAIRHEMLTSRFRQIQNSIVGLAPATKYHALLTLPSCSSRKYCELLNERQSIKNPHFFNAVSRQLQVSISGNDRPKTLRCEYYPVLNCVP